MSCVVWCTIFAVPGLAHGESVGPKPGERLAPYMSVISVGPKRGQLHCFV
ncbi:MAG: hypothetical protein RMJ19_05800 [Gemmatales bacterium]|nr:hypothetical protein [Gemmatales bacterium]MCS7159966.1 hypothetical protein [Gemmatales bacterium]MDW8175165.1 hypothetical protein [Gemmatales bacterium]MDW8223924.1 hypothetical protein [Gemmatales bacterium]